MTAIPFIHTETDLSSAVERLVAADARLAHVLAVGGQPPLRRRTPGFAGLAAIVCGQQLSTASADAIFGRLCRLGDPLEHPHILRARADRLQRLGLSAAKIRTLKAVAQAIGDGTLNLEALHRLPADEARAGLTAIHGIGPWTADMYLLACLGHADAWPGGDLALQEASRIAFRLRDRPKTREMGVIAEAWRPWRGVAARMLWTYYRAIKGRSGAPLQDGRSSASGSTA